ncbi:MAG: hypothetical protein ABI151_08155 [Chitinophagaceae bacterium]
MQKLFFWAFFLVTVLHITLTTRAQAPGLAPTGPTSIRVEGEGLKSFTFSSSDFKPAMVQAIIRKEPDGSSHTFSGLALSDILTMGGLSVNGGVKGKLLSNYLLVEAADGYQVVFALADLDSNFTGNRIILANMMDGKALAAGKGPFQLIVQHDKNPGRWVKMVSAITVRSASRNQ